jgi:apolipoprotein N-acyltransferase
MMFLSLILSFLMGAILPFAFAPLSVYAFAFIAPAVLLYQWQKSTPWQAFLKGGAFGLGFYGAGVSWVYISIHNYGNASAPVASLITFAMIAFLTLGPATQGYLLIRLFGKKSPQALCLGAFPATWVIWEWLRSLPLNGFPWLYLGYTQMTTPLRGFAPVLGVYGVSLVVAIIGGCIVLMSTRQWLKTKLTALVILLVILGIGWILTGRQWTKPAGQPLNVTLVQANISQSIKWQPGQFDHILQTYQELTKPAWTTSRLIIWPEAALPAFPGQIPNTLQKLDQTAAEGGSTLLLGILLGEPNSREYYNGIRLLGVDQGDYRKRHLVPFGEYTPLKSVFSFLINYWQIPMSDFSTGPVQQPILAIGKDHLAPFICYEIAYPFEVLKYTRDRQFIVNISDDSWFGKSPASAQQAQMAQMRALETGRYVLLGGNTGITAIIDPLGTFIAALPPHQSGILNGSVRPMQGNTPLMRWNYYPLLGLVILLLILSAF